MADASVTLRKLKTAAFKTVLEPAGFIKGKHLFVRRVAEQAHGMAFQPSKYGGEYFVNVAFTYTFLPVYGEESVSPESLSTPRFMLRTRLGRLIPIDADYDRSGARFDDVGAEAATQHAERHARDAVRILDELSTRWKDPAVFLELLPPELIEKDYRMRIENAPGPWAIHDAVGQWDVDHFNISCALTVIAVRAGEIDAAGRYLQLAEARAAEQGMQAMVAPLRQRVEAGREAKPG